MPRCDDILTNKEESKCAEDTENLAAGITTQLSSLEHRQTMTEDPLSEGPNKDIQNESATPGTVTKTR